MQEKQAGADGRGEGEEVPALLGTNGGLFHIQDQDEVQDERVRVQGARGWYFCLSVTSVILGCSCIGVIALIHAVKAREREKSGDLEGARRFSGRALKFSALSLVVIVLWVFLALGLVVLISYLARVAE
ncbi:transmembrane protein 265-like [Narcine bancroftii]|uniref:transmembrane protein 265-like n=1 Tax=Narcine bancroftii TaxID=1343680 RepID=UPI0038321091